MPGENVPRRSSVNAPCRTSERSMIGNSKTILVTVTVPTFLKETHARAAVSSRRTAPQPPVTSIFPNVELPIVAVPKRRARHGLGVVVGVGAGLPFDETRTSQTDIRPGTVVRQLPVQVPPLAFATPGHLLSASDWLQIGPASTSLTTEPPFDDPTRTSQTDIRPGTVVRQLPVQVPPFAFATPGHLLCASDWLQIGPASTSIVLPCATATGGNAAPSSAAAIPKHRE